MKKLFFIHLFVWLGFISWGFLGLYLNRPEEFFFWELVFTYILLAFEFYTFSLFLLPRFFATKRYISFAVYAFCFYFVFLFLDYLIENVFSVWYYKRPPIPFKFNSFLIPVWDYFVVYMLFAFGYYFARQSVSREKLLRTLVEEQHEQAIKIAQAKEERILQQSREETLKLEKENAHLENAFLRAQISPHFLFNTLSFVYNTIKDSSVDAGNSILLLSEMMQYSITKNGSDGFVLLEEEVEQIEHLIAIHQLRFNRALHISFEQTGAIDKVRIIPHV
jgi:two-component system, LytTR family, sensor kinase